MYLRILGLAGSLRRASSHPEYDYAIPGVLTAALDWCLRSRYDRTPLRHKPVGIVGRALEAVGLPEVRWS